MLIVEPSGPQGMSINVGDTIEPSILEQCIAMVVWDLITIMCREGLKVSGQEEKYDGSEYFFRKKKNNKAYCDIF